MKYPLLVAWFLFGNAISGLCLAQVGPNVTHTNIAASVAYNPSTYTYTYVYSVSSLPENTGAISSVDIDITTKITTRLNVPDPVPDVPAVKNFLLEEFDKKGLNVLPVEITAPMGWSVMPLTVYGTAAWVENTSAEGLAPGQTVTGLTLTAKFVPDIRSIRVSPATYQWDLLPDVENPPEVQAQKQAFIDSLDVMQPTLGPVEIYNLFDHWNHLRDSLNKAISLGWVPDAALADALVSQLASAREAFDVQNGDLARNRLETLIATVTQAGDQQCRGEVRDLVALNAQRLMETVPETPISFAPLLTLSPRRATLPLGADYTVKARVVNSADNNAPVPNLLLQASVVQGPHAGSVNDAKFTDGNGEATFGFKGSRLGTDEITVIFRDRSSGELPALSESAKVTWSGGADLLIPFFIPPEIDTRLNDKAVFVTDITTNVGNVPADASTTRYYLSATPPPFDFGQVQIIGERLVPPLTPGQENRVDRWSYTLPKNLVPGIYYMAACADAAAVVAETEEENNCSYSELKYIKRAAIIPVKKQDNEPPDCSASAPSVASLWPPNHKLLTIEIIGVTDPNDDPVTIRVDGITQDEPVNDRADGDTSPDGFGVGEALIQLRAERSGDGDGRVYHVSFTASDDRGGGCTGTIVVGVPHDRGKGATPIDSGQSYDPTTTL